MKAVLIKEYGSADQMYLGEAPKPQVGEKELLIRVKATAVNRADILQRRGGYAPPPGASDILGLELAGVIEEIGSNSSPNWKVGDRVASLLTGGGYAEYCTIPESLAIPIPESLSFSQAAAIPEVWMTAYQNLYFVAEMERVQPEYVLFHAGASGVGVAAIQLISQFGAKAIVTCGSQEKVEFCKSIGAYAAINYKEEDFVEKIKEITQGKGVGIVIDCVGGSYFQRNLESLQNEGRLILIGWLTGSKVPDCDLTMVLRKRLRIEGSTLRARSVEYKQKLTEEIKNYCIPRFLDGRMKIVVDKEFPIEEIAEAHRYIEENKNKGKVVITL